MRIPWIKTNVLCLCLALLLPHFSSPPDTFASESRAKRQEKREARAKKLREKMHRTYGGSCGAGTEKAGGYPPDSRSLHCRYPTTKGPVKHGKFYKWWPDGSVRVEGEFWQGKKHGTWISYLPNGRKKRQEVYYAGKRQSAVRFNDKGEAEPLLSAKEKREKGSASGTRAKIRSDF